MQTVKERLVAFLTYKKISQKTFAEKVGVSSGYVNAIRVSIQPKTLEKISEAFPDLNISWLLTGDGDMLKTSIQSTGKELGGVYSVGSNDIEVSQVVYVPVSAHATFIENLDIPDKMERYPVILTRLEKDEIEKYKIFEVEGDSMYPSISNGALILAKEIPERNWHYAEGVAVVIFSEFVVVKRIERNDLLTDNIVVLSSDNQRYGKLTVQLADIRAIYKAKRILSSEIK